MKSRKIFAAVTAAEGKKIIDMTVTGRSIDTDLQLRIADFNMTTVCRITYMKTYKKIPPCCTGKLFVYSSISLFICGTLSRTAAPITVKIISGSIYAPL